MKRRSTYFTAAYREETVGASLGAGSMEVASELWTERVFVAQVDSNGASPLSRKAMIGQVEFDSAMSRQRQSARFFANAGGITD